MHNLMGSVVLGGPSPVFCGYGVSELTLAYQTAALKAWSERAVAGSAGIFVAAVFAGMTLQIHG
jgi:hypothetical protein